MAAILQAKDPVAALANSAKYYNYHNETSGITPAKIVSENSEEILEAKWNYMQKYKFNETLIAFLSNTG